MKDQEKTREQLVKELWELRQRIAELEAFEAERKRVEKALRVERWVTGASTRKSPLCSLLLHPVNLKDVGLSDRQLGAFLPYNSAHNHSWRLERLGFMSPVAY